MQYHLAIDTGACWQAAEKGQLTDKTKADTIKELLPVVDSFEMAKGQLKPETEGEKNIDGSYQVPCTDNL